MGVGANYIGLRMFEEALTPLRKSIEIDPHLKEAYVRRVIALLMIGKANEALPVVLQLVEKNPEYPYSKAVLSAARFCAGEEQKALQLVDEMIVSNLDFRPFFADLVRQLKENDQIRYAIGLLEPLYRSDKINQELGLLLVECYRAQALVA